MLLNAEVKDLASKRPFEKEWVEQAVFNFLVPSAHAW